MQITGVRKADVEANYETGPGGNAPVPGPPQGVICHGR